MAAERGVLFPWREPQCHCATWPADPGRSWILSTWQSGSPRHHPGVAATSTSSSSGALPGVQHKVVTASVSRSAVSRAGGWVMGVMCKRNRCSMGYQAVHAGGTPTRRAAVSALTISGSLPDVVLHRDGGKPEEQEEKEEEGSRLTECCLPDGSRLTIAVLLSGGVDSSVALRLLLEAGHKCVGYYLKIWFQDDFRNFWEECPWEEDLSYAQQVCDQAGVELRVVHLTDAYWNKVVSHCVAEIKAGRTPNPDVLCNSRIKFGAFYDHISFDEFDRVASGHYARVIRETTPAAPGMVVTSPGNDLPLTRVQLTLSADEVKDQTYFLSHLTQEQLTRVIFPLGHLTKAQVRKVAEHLKLPNCGRKDSQGICFLGKVKFSEFIEQHLGKRTGRIIEAETGLVLGLHQGFWFHTIGQRQGLGLSGGPWYVVAKDPTHNVVFVSRDYYSEDKRRRAFRAGDLNWIGQPPRPAESIRCKVRHGPRFHDCTIEFETGPENNKPGRNVGSTDKVPVSSRAPTTLQAGEAGQEQLEGARASPARSTAGSQSLLMSTTARAFGKKNGGQSKEEEGEGGGERRGGEWAVGETVIIRLMQDDQGLAPGQFVAFYRQDVCVGAGVILETLGAEGARETTLVSEKAMSVAKSEDAGSGGKWIDKPLSGDWRAHRAKRKGKQKQLPSKTNLCEESENLPRQSQSQRPEVPENQERDGDGIRHGIDILCKSLPVPSLQQESHEVPF